MYGFGMDYGLIKTDMPIADTVYGKVCGENRKGIAVFRGIPYGGGSGGQKRFLAPEAAKAWEGIRDCRKNGFYAPQLGTSISGDIILGAYFSGGHPEKFGCGEEKQGEDCLVLNVLTPGCDNRKRPVVVYIHGGGFATGSGTLVLGADEWVREEDIVVVGVNHRLNIFGYLYLGEIDDRYRDSGVAGLLDLVLALEWVQDNIRNFGGDPGNVTIMGESGGGAKVSMLLAMKEAQGLFHKAIVESGSVPIGKKNRKEAVEQTRRLLKQLKVPEDHLELLWEKSIGELLEAMEEAGDTKAMDFIPVADETHLLPHRGYVAPEGSEKIPLLTGTSEDELAVFLDIRLLDEITWENMAEYLQKTAEAWMPLYCLDKDNIPVVIERFRGLDKKEENPGHLFAKIVSQISALGSGSYYQAMTKAGQEAPVYHYVVSYDVPHPAVADGENIGNNYGKHSYAWHTADLPLQMRIVLHPECEEISRYMAHAWAAFIRSGNPSTEDIIWEPFTREGKKTMVISEKCYMQYDPLGKMRCILEEYGKE